MAKDFPVKFKQSLNFNCSFHAVVEFFPSLPPHHSAVASHEEQEQAQQQRHNVAEGREGPKPALDLTYSFEWPIAPEAVTEENTQRKNWRCYRNCVFFFWTIRNLCIGIHRQPFLAPAKSAGSPGLPFCSWQSKSIYFNTNVNPL